jgi:hypothetical protein
MWTWKSVRLIGNEALTTLEPGFAALYARNIGPPSITPEELLRAFR